MSTALVILACLLAPLALIYWLRQAHKQAMRDRRVFPPDEPSEKKPLDFLARKNIESFIAWRRRWIAAHPQTIVTQRFPSEELLNQLELPALLRRQV